MTKDELFAKATAFKQSCEEEKDIKLHIRSIFIIIIAILNYLLTKE